MIKYITLLCFLFSAQTLFSQSALAKERIKWVNFQWNDPKDKDAIFLKSRLDTLDYNFNWQPMKRTKIIYWTTTVIIFLFEGVMPALASQTALAKEGMRHLGYPEYFGNAFVFFKVLGALALVIPKIPNRIKEWAYACFAFDFIFACKSHTAVDGFGGQAIFPLLVLAILITSYISHEKLKQYPNQSKVIFKTDNHVYSGIGQ